MTARDRLKLSPIMRSITRSLILTRNAITRIRTIRWDECRLITRRCTTITSIISSIILTIHHLIPMHTRSIIRIRSMLLILITLILILVQVSTKNLLFRLQRRRITHARKKIGNRMIEGKIKSQSVRKGSLNRRENHTKRKDDLINSKNMSRGMSKEKHTTTDPGGIRPNKKETHNNPTKLDSQANQTANHKK